MLKPGASKTFANYSNEVFLSYVKGQLHSVQIIYVVWDRYLPNSLKATTRENRGSGVEESSPTQEFLEIGQNSY
jgi:hypothetical protein